MADAAYYPPDRRDYDGMYEQKFEIVNLFMFSDYENTGPVGTVTSPPVLSSRTQYEFLIDLS